MPAKAGISSTSITFVDWARPMRNSVGMAKHVVIICGFVLSGCGDACENQIVSETKSPDSQYSAVIFQRDCGATTGFTTQVSILPLGENPERSGNVFVADDNHGAAQVGSWGGPWVSVKWRNSSHLQVTYAKGSRVFDQTENVGGVSVSFDTQASQ